MKKHTLGLITLLLLGLWLAAPATAQKPRPDAHLLQGLDREAVPRYPSIDAFLKANPGGDLQARATVVGRAKRVPTALRAEQVRGLHGAGLNAASALGTVRLERAGNGTVRWLRGRLGQVERPAGKRTAAHDAQAARSVVAQVGGLLGLQDPADELRLNRVATDDLGFAHLRFEQTYAGLPVWGRDLFVHLDAEGVVYALNGTYEPTPRGLDATPVLRAGEALAVVEADLTAQGRWAPLGEEAAAWLGLDGPASRLVVYPDAVRGMRLAYEVSLHPNLLEWYTYLVDARTGAVLNRIARHCTLYAEAALPAPPRTVSLPAAPGPRTRRGVFFDAAAVDLNGQNQSLRVYQHDDGLFYSLWDLDNLDQNQSQFPDNPAGGALTISANNSDFDNNVQLTHVTSNNNTWADPAGVSAHLNMNAAYEYYQGTHNRRAINDQDESIISVIHVTDGGQSMENAFWNGRLMAYGDGGSFFKPLAGSRSVAGHEMTHGVIQHSADLIYQFQSGALNESFADVFGVFIEPNDFLLGEDIMQPTAGIALRDLLNPDNPQVASRQPAHMSQFQNLNATQDNGGVHVNSGIPNRAAALLIQTIGTAQAEQIYYRALTVYLTRNSQFGDARNAVEQAASDLFGAGSSPVAAVQQAFDDVGIEGTTGTGGDGGNDLPPQVGGQSLVAFLLEDGSIGLLDLTDPATPTASLFEDPAARANVMPAGFRAQLTTPLTGETIWFINDQGQLAFIDLANNDAVNVFPDLFIQQQGDLRNASIAPDEGLAALVSVYADDPTLYITNGLEIAAIDLLPQTTQEGIFDESIQFPDVVSWSPNPQVPRIAFDAFSQVPVGMGSMLSYWGMYEIDFEAGTIFNLVPAQPSGISVGNITYSNTDPDVIAFNLFDDTGTADVLVGNFATGDVAALNLPSFTLDGVPVTDAQRPTFSPDNGQLAFTSEAQLALLVFDRASEELSALTFQQPIFNPRWFVAGGSGGSQNQAPSASFTANTSGGSAPLLVTLDAGASSDPNGDPLTFRWSFGDGTNGSGQTASHTYAATGTFTIRLTVTDSGGLSGTATLDITVATGVATEDEAGVPAAFSLHPNYPNPFNPTTTLAYDLAQPGPVRLAVYDLFGREVARLVDAVQPAGRYAVAFEAEGLASGTYFYRIEAGAWSRTRQLVLLK